MTKAPKQKKYAGTSKMPRGVRLAETNKGRDVAQAVLKFGDSVIPKKDPLKSSLVLIRESTLEFLQQEADEIDVTRSEYIRLCVESVERVLRYRRGQVWDAIGQKWVIAAKK